MTLTMTNLNGNIILTLSLKMFVYRYYGKYDMMSSKIFI